MRILALDLPDDLRRELTNVGADESCWEIFASKWTGMAVKLEGLSTASANILKQTALVAGGDCAIHRQVVSGRKRKSDAVLFVNRRQLGVLASRLESQPDCVARLAPHLVELDRSVHDPELTIRLGRRKVNLGARTHVMGILNVTPDSFYDKGKHFELGAAAVSYTHLTLPTN